VVDTLSVPLPVPVMVKVSGGGDCDRADCAASGSGSGRDAGSDSGRAAAADERFAGGDQRRKRASALRETVVVCVAVKECVCKEVSVCLTLVAQEKECERVTAASSVKEGIALSVAELTDRGPVSVVSRWQWRCACCQGGRGVRGWQWPRWRWVWLSLWCLSGLAGAKGSDSGGGGRGNALCAAQLGEAL
jgi:hypothetical protein